MIKKTESPEEALKSARSYVLWLLSRRDYSRHTLESKLKARGIPLADGRALLDALVEEGYFREQNYQKARTRQLLRKGLGASLVKARLRGEKCTVSDGDIKQAFGDIGTDAHAELRTLVEKTVRRLRRRGGYSERELRQRVIRALAAKGHRAGEVLAVLDEPSPASSD